MSPAFTSPKPPARNADGPPIRMFSTTLHVGTFNASFNVTVERSSSATPYTDNGNGYSVLGRIICQYAQSFSNVADDGTGHGSLTVVEAVRYRPLLPIYLPC